MQRSERFGGDSGVSLTLEHVQQQEGEGGGEAKAHGKTVGENDFLREFAESVFRESVLHWRG